jgi:predicted Fe-Mo cluster-binding NifX family protein
MKIAITTSGTKLEDPFEMRFGRTKYFLIYDTETKMARAVNNDQNMFAAQGAGIQAAQCVANKGVQCVITGHCGPKHFVYYKRQVFRSYANVKCCAEAVEAFSAGKLTAVAAADVEGHWA